MEQKMRATISCETCLDSLIQVRALLTLVDQVILNQDVLHLHGESIIGLSVILGEAKRLVHIVEEVIGGSDVDPA